MSKRKKKTNIFLVSWDMTGLETVIDLSEVEARRKQADKERVWNTLASPDLVDPGNPIERQISSTVNAILMRARINSQRHYEVYTIHTDSSVAEKDVWTMFADNPQGAAELIRDRGTKLYSNRMRKGEIQIT
jgi:hypothetical protein